MTDAIAHRTATANGVRIHYLTAGTGAPLVLLHGWPVSAEMWRRVMPALAANRTVIAPDLRGAGYSDKPAAGYDKATLAKDVQALMAGLGHARYAVVGHDIGGMVAYALAAQFRGEVEKLAIVDVPLPGVDPWDKMQGAPALWHFGFHAQRDLAEALIQGRERLYIESFVRSRAWNPAAMSEDEIDFYARQMAQPGALRGGLEYYRTIAEDAAANKGFAAEKLACPMLGIGGDRLGPVLKGITAAVAGDARAVTIGQCGHWVVEERPAEFLAALREFLG
ncbi:MAG: alpha/beta hydrolase [Rhodospirillaceae bacterium]|nr:alpha/beta hydrolase [Rhodospirillaceae bacterium]